MKRVLTASALSFCLALAACGRGGEETAAPDTAPAKAPAAAAGTPASFEAAYIARLNTIAELMEGVTDEASATAAQARIEAESEALETMLEAEQAKDGFQTTALRLATSREWVDANVRLLKAVEAASKSDPRISEALAEAMADVPGN